MKHNSNVRNASATIANTNESNMRQTQPTIHAIPEQLIQPIYASILSCLCVCAWTGFVCIYGLIYLLQTYKYTWTQICIHLFTHKWTIWLWICMCLCCCACQHAHLCVLICMHMQFWTSINVYACKYANLCLYKFRCATAFVYIHIYVYM